MEALFQAPIELLQEVLTAGIIRCRWDSSHLHGLTARLTPFTMILAMDPKSRVPKYHIQCLLQGMN
jgi:hypothetical protein